MLCMLQKHTHIIKMEKQINKITENIEGQQATHSGWNHYLMAFSKYRDECTRLGMIVHGADFRAASLALTDYHSTLYTMAQQIFFFYDPILETELTEEWFDLGDEVNGYLSLYNDPQMRSQMFFEMQHGIPRELRMKLIKYFNKIDRYAAEAGLHVNKEDKRGKEPKKGLLGLK